MSKKSTIPHRDQQPFLATTALEDFWDTSKPLLFLGEWCRRYSRKSFWEFLDGTVIDSPWDSTTVLSEAIEYTEELHERLLPPLAKSMNAIHGLHYSDRYWRIMLGPWLLLYLPMLYDRYMCLRSAINRYPDITTTVLAEQSWITPRDTMECYQLIMEDPYNLQMYSHILKLLGRNFSESPYVVVADASFLSNTDRSLSYRVLEWSAFLLNSINRLVKHGHSIILRFSYFSLPVHLQLACRTTGKVWPIVVKNLKPYRYDPDIKARSILRDLLVPRNEFERICNAMLPTGVPQIFVEGFVLASKAAKRDYPSPPKAIFSASAWYFDEVFKHWAGACAEEGTLLLGAQHGGNYGSLRYNRSEQHEIEITDRFYTWGWDWPSAANNIFPSFSPKLTGRKSMKASNHQQGILFSTTTSLRYLFCQFPIVPVEFDHYHSWHTRFLKMLSPRLLPSLRVRCHREDFGADMAYRWKDHYPDIFIEQWDVPFLTSLDRCRIYVCDILATTFLEALSANKPTILFWDPSLNELRPEARPYYDALREVGILHDTPESAAGALNRVFDDTERWWNDEGLQTARRSFCTRFANTSPHDISHWAKEFNRLSEEDIPKKTGMRN